MKMKYNHISEWERKIIEQLVQAVSSNKAIAAILKRSVSTIIGITAMALDIF